MSGVTREQVVAWAEQSGFCYEDCGNLYPAVREDCDMNDEAAKFAALAYAAGQESMREKLRAAEEFMEFAWRDVPMNEYATERLEEALAKIREE